MRKKEDRRVYFDEIDIEKTATKKSWKFIYSWADVLIFACVAVMIVYTFLFRVVGVSGDSMNPTLKNGDMLVVSAMKTNYQRGDIVVVTQPNQLNEPLIKRIIAVGGDTVDINFADGTVSINGTALTETYIKEKTEAMGDIAFPVTVPEGCVFVMGDNRNHSYDSRRRNVGFIDERYILGKAEFRLLPAGQGSLY